MSVGRCTGVAILAVCSLVCGLTRAAERAMSDLLPPTTAAYVEVSQTGDWTRLAWENPITRRIVELPEFEAGMKTPQSKQFLAGVKFVEERLGMKIRPALESLVAHGACLAVDAETQGVALILHAKDEECLDKAIAVMQDLARLDGVRRGVGDPIEVVEYRGRTAYKIDKAFYAKLGSLLAFTNNAPLGRKIVDRFLDEDAARLTTHETFQLARTQAAAGQTPWAWGFVRLDVLREHGLAKKVFQGKTENPLAELLVGGIMSNLQQSPFATMAVHVEDQDNHKQIRLSVACPSKKEWVPETRAFYFGPQGDSKATQPLTVPSTLLNFTTHRDVSGMWLASHELFEENVLAEMAKAESGLGLFFGGRDFAKDVLGSFGPHLQVVLARQTFEQSPITPAIKLPAGAIVLEMKDAAKMKDRWKATFQSIVGFINVAGSQEKFPLLEQSTENREDGFLISTKYLVEEDQREVQQGKINFNFTPSLAQTGSYLILSSTRQLAEQLLESCRQGPRDGETNTELRLNVQTGQQMLKDNLDHLLAQNMLEKGHTEAEAKRELDLAMEFLSWFQSSKLQLTNQKDTLRLEWNIEVGQ